jgi:hypothetical protein
METLLNFVWTPSIQFIPPIPLHTLRQLRLRVTFRQGLFYHIWIPWAPFKSSNPLISATHSGAMHNLSYESKQDFRTTLALIKCHISIGGNEGANTAARDATTQGALEASALNLDFKTALRRCILAKLQQYWDHTQGNKLRNVKPMVLPWRSSCLSVRYDDVVVTRLMFGLTCLTQPSSVLQYTLCVCPLPCRTQYQTQPNVQRQSPEMSLAKHFQRYAGRRPRYFNTSFTLTCHCHLRLLWLTREPFNMLWPCVYLLADRHK